MVGFDPEHVKLSQKEYAQAGAISGALARAVVQPLDVLKIRFQLQVEPIKKSHASSKYHSIIQAVQRIVKEEGITALWKGHVPAQALSVLYGLVQFSTFEYLTKQVWDHLPSKFTNDLRPLTHTLCGASAACIGTLAIQPLDVLRTRFVAQGEPKHYRSLPHAAHMIVTKEGVFAFYKGLLPTLVGVAPQMGLQFGFYAFLTKTWDRTVGKSQNKYVGPFESLVCGSGSGMAAKLVIYPLDVVKKRLQVQGFEEARKAFGATRKYNGLVHCLVSLAKEEQLRGMYKGLSPSLLKAAVVSGLNFFFYDQIIRIYSLSKR